MDYSIKAFFSSIPLAGTVVIKRPLPLDNKTAERLSKVHSTNTSVEKLFKNAMRSLKITGIYGDIRVLGKPDFVNHATKVAVFLDGCFWHGHVKCYKEPTHNRDYWQTKILTNKKRRQKVRHQLKKEGWLVLEFWECMLRKDIKKIIKRVEQVIKQRSRLGY